MSDGFIDTLVYIHGFGSSGNGNKVDFLRKVSKELEMDFIAVEYDSSAKHEDCLAAIENQVPKDGCSLIVGTSLGAYYAIIVSNMTVSPSIVLNPSLDPYNSLNKYLDNPVNNFYSNKKSIESYKDKSYPMPRYGCVAMFETGDEVLDHSPAINKLEGHAVIKIIEGGSHRFESYDLLKEEIIKLNNMGVQDYDEDY